jgi:hypothetical protein
VAVSAVIVVKCDGTKADRPTVSLETCRGAFPTRTADRVDALEAAKRNGWSIVGLDRHLCPACTRAKR